MKSAISPWLLAVCAAVGVGCTTADKTQVLTGKVTTTGAIAVRVVANGNVVTAGRVRSDGSFSLAVPTGTQYRLEVLTANGVRHFVGHDGSSFKDLAFSVCEPTDPWDMGGVGSAGSGTGGGSGCGGGSGSGSGSGGGTGPCDPMDPNGMCPPPPPPPPMCDPTTDPNCPCVPDPSGNCGQPCDPMDPSGMCPPPPPPPPPCDPATDPNCPCMPDGTGNCGQPCDPMDPNGMCPPPPPPPQCDPGDPNCPPCMPDASGNCTGTCDPTTDPMCTMPPPPCDDPMDPSSCQDPCMNAPGQCGCTMTDPNCWPPPAPCDASGQCGDGMMPDHPPGDFGCTGPSGS